MSGNQDPEWRQPRRRQGGFPGRGQASSSGSAQQDPRKRLDRISREMSKLLRHHPPPSMDGSGWVALPELLSLLKSRPSEEELREVVRQCPKQRYAVDDDKQPARVRAVQGHSVQLDAPILDPITDASQVPIVIHITSTDGWRLIQQSGELRRMTRTHIHFASEPHHLRKNAWADVLLRLDVAVALAEGHGLWRAANGVVLCEGPVPVRLVTCVKREELPESWRKQ